MYTLATQAQVARPSHQAIHDVLAAYHAPLCLTMLWPPATLKPQLEAD